MGKFKSGDILVCIPGFHGDEISIQVGIDNGIDNGGSGYEVGLISKVDDAWDDICFGFKNGDGVYDKALRLATPAEEVDYLFNLSFILSLMISLSLSDGL